MNHLSFSQSFLVLVTELAVSLQLASFLSLLLSAPSQHLTNLQSSIILVLTNQRPVRFMNAACISFRLHATQQPPLARIPPLAAAAACCFPMWTVATDSVSAPPSLFPVESCNPFLVRFVCYASKPPELEGSLICHCLAFLF